MHKLIAYTILLISLGLLATTSSAQQAPDAAASEDEQRPQVYRWVDEQGNVSFTDRPPPESKAEAVDLPPLQEFQSPKLPSQDQTKAVKKKPPPKYRSFAITYPENDAAIRDNAGNIRIDLNLTPGLQAQNGHKIYVYMDGLSVSEGQQMTIAMQNVDRGTHELFAVVKDRMGAPLITTDTIRITILRHSVRF